MTSQNETAEKPRAEDSARRPYKKPTLKRYASLAHLNLDAFNGKVTTE